MLVRIGVDVGGTFTDFVVVSDEGMRHHKVLSTPQAPEEAVLAGLADLDIDGPVMVVHGSTVATNAFLERKGARVALVATEGFEDVLEIGRQDRVGIYDLHSAKPAALVEVAGRFGVPERLDHRGEVVEPLTDAAAARLAEAVQAYAPDAVAVVLLHAYANPEHERRIGRALSGQGQRHVYLSSVIDPEHREFERASTTALTAYVAPVVEGYLGHLSDRLGARLRVMSSTGGQASAARVVARPVAMMLSGPAGGVVGALSVARQAGFDRIVTFDMGGTSTDVAVVAGRVPVTRESRFDHLPVRAPMVDVHTVGAGGGSIARFDLGGSLRVGPQSAGARPGPACYGQGGDAPTVTDAHLILGRLDPGRFSAGGVRLSPEASREAFARLRRQGGEVGAAAMDDTALAEGVIAVANAAMERAIRRVTAQRGIDPAGHVLVSFGGAGGLHAAALARALGMRGVLVPPQAGTLSALGLALADALSDHMQSVLADLVEANGPVIAATLAALQAQGRAVLAREGYDRHRIEVEAFLDLRYRGESYELMTPWQGTPEATRRAFDALHREQFLHADSEAIVECVNAYVRVFGREPGRALAAWPTERSCRPFAVRRVWIGGRERDTSLYDRADLGAGARLHGPALVFESSATTLIEPDDTAEVDALGNLHMTLGGGR